MSLSGRLSSLEGLRILQMSGLLCQSRIGLLGLPPRWSEGCEARIRQATASITDALRRGDDHSLKGKSLG